MFPFFFHQLHSLSSQRATCSEEQHAYHPEPGAAHSRGRVGVTEMQIVPELPVTQSFYPLPRLTVNEGKGMNSCRGGGWVKQETPISLMQVSTERRPISTVKLALGQTQQRRK